MADVINSPLNEKAKYENIYNPNLLFPIARETKRKEIGVDDKSPNFTGFDLWNHYEISWLNSKGKPQVACGQIEYSSGTPNIIESKSMKLYFNSLNNTKFTSWQELENIVTKDLSSAVKGEVKFKLVNLEEQSNTLVRAFNGVCLDNLDIFCTIYQPYPDYLFTNDMYVEEELYSDLLKSNCLVTNQPDWGSIFICYKGRQIDHEGLLKYIVSLRDHNEFHEQCVERVFTEILNRCKPVELTVYARYTRRGGIDINPFRTNCESVAENIRLIRQ